MYPVRALIRGHPVYRVDRGPYPAGADQVNDEANPLYGSEGEDPNPEFASAADVIERLRSEVADPKAFEREGAFLGCFGDAFLALRGPPALHEEVAAWLDRTERRVLRTVLLDVAAFRGEPSAADSPGGVPAAVACGAWAPLGVVRMVLSPQGTGAARAGAVRAYLQDYDVEVAAESSTADPIVGVAPEGLAADAVTSGVLGDRARVHLRSWWASPATWEERTTKDGDRIEVPTIAGATLDADVELGGGTWTVLPATGGTVFAARLRVTDEGAGARSAAERAPAPSGAPPPPGPLALRSFDVRDLSRPVRSGRGIEAGPPPSNFTPARPPGLAEPAALATPDGLATLLKSLASPASWAREGASIEAVDESLLVRNDEATLAELGALLDRLRAHALATTTVRATIVSLPLSSLPEWWKGLPEELPREGAAGLLKRPGAQVVNAASLRLREGQRQAALGGDHRTYVADYDVEIALNSAIGNPIVRQLFEGLSLDVEADRVSRVPAVRLGLRVDDSRVLALRSVPTRHGDIDCPTVALSRLRGEATVALGTTRVLGAWGVGGEIRLLLVTATD